jgi:hypothetical protein
MAEGKPPAGQQAARGGIVVAAVRRRGEGRSPEPPCLTALTHGLTNDGGMTDYLLLFLGTSRAMTPYRRNDRGTNRRGGAAAPCWRSSP